MFSTLEYMVFYVPIVPWPISFLERPVTNLINEPTYNTSLVVIVSAPLFICESRFQSLPSSILLAACLLKQFELSAGLPDCKVTNELNLLAYPNPPQPERNVMPTCLYTFRFKSSSNPSRVGIFSFFFSSLISPSPNNFFFPTTKVRSRRQPQK